MSGDASQTENAGRRRSPRASARTLYLIHVLTHSTRTRLDEALRPLGLTGFHYTVLSVLERHSGMSSADLSQRFHVTPQSMGQLIALLEAKGFLSRRESEANRKRLLLSLTAEGARAVRAGAAIVEAFERKLFRGVPAEEIETLRRIVAQAIDRTAAWP